jgi:hypothetical protein
MRHGRIVRRFSCPVPATKSHACPPTGAAVLEAVPRQVCIVMMIPAVAARAGVSPRWVVAGGLPDLRTGPRRFG